jgi:hypothetical protein
MDRSLEDIRGVLDEILQHHRRLPSLWSIAVAVIVPTLLGLIAAAQLFARVDANTELLHREEAHFEAVDAHIGVLERQMAVLLDREHEPFQDTPTSPPPSSPSLRRH